jgi:hypothetical protein
MLKPVLLAEGRVLGIWKSMRKKDQLEIIVEPFEQLTPQVRAELEADATSLGRFLGIQATVNIM